MDLSPFSETRLAAAPRLAVLVDGDNISASAAAWVLTRAASYGHPLVRRVYGDAAKLPKWHAEADFRIVHAGVGKNATDLLLTVEAMAFVLSRQVDGVVLVSSDRDFSHLAHHLREAGYLVVGLGEPKAPAMFRQACSKFEVLPTAVPVVSAAAAVVQSTLDKQICDELRDCAAGDGLLLTELNARLQRKHQTAISQRTEKTWRAYLLARPGLFVCDPKRPQARVRLRQGLR